MSNILILGTGCVGSVYACILGTRSRSRITCVCRSNYDAVKTHGLRISSSIFGEPQFRPIVVRSVAEAIEHSVEPFEFVLVCTKATDASIATTIKQLDTLLSAQQTSIVLIQNGLGVEKSFHKAFPGTTIISGVAYLPTTQISPAVFVHSEIEILHIGLYPSAAPSKELISFAKLVCEGGATARIHEDIQAERWRKIVANGAVSPICALSRCRDRELLEISVLGNALFKEVMQEIASVAVSAGYGDVVTQAVVDAQLARTLSRPYPGVQPSMMSDALEGRPMEVHAVVGEIVKVAVEKGIRIPRLATLYVLLIGLDNTLQEKAGT